MYKYNLAHGSSKPSLLAQLHYFVSFAETEKHFLPETVSAHPGLGHRSVPHTANIRVTSSYRR